MKLAKSHFSIRIRFENELGAQEKSLKKTELSHADPSMFFPGANVRYRLTTGSTLISGGWHPDTGQAL